MVLLRIKDYNVSSLNNDTTKVRRTESSYEVDVDFMTSSILKGQWRAFWWKFNRLNVHCPNITSFWEIA